MSSNYHMKQKTFIEARCCQYTLSGIDFFEAVTFEGLWDVFQTEWTNLKHNLNCMSLCSSREEKIK